MNNKNIKHENVKKSFSLVQKRKHELNKIKLYITLTLSITLIFVVIWILAMIPSTFSAKLRVYKYDGYTTDWKEWRLPIKDYENPKLLFVYNEDFLFYSGTLGAIAFYSIALILACLPFYAFAYFFLYKRLYVRKLQEFDKANTKWKDAVSSQQ
ncbi:hypothetical protein ACNQ17_00730 [Mycoplasma sp. Sp48II]|uniref:hypothetical protein n=1 Tax=Mycoplasma sp. Sp48II TaxID=3401682 RepID=UPI003AAFDED1